MPPPPLLQEATELAIAWGVNWKEAIRALIVLPLLYAMLTQLRNGPDPNAYGFWEALVSGLTAVTVFMALWWLIRRHQLVNQKEEEHIPT